MTPPSPVEPTPPAEFSRQIHSAWCEGRLLELIREIDDRTEKEGPQAEAMAEHLEACRREARRVAELDNVLRSGFEALREEIPLPGEDRIVAMLRRVELAPEVQLQRRVRRTLRPVLWLVFYLLLLLASAGLVTAAWRAFFSD